MPDINSNEAHARSQAHAESVVKGSGTSFFWAMRRMPDEKRHAMYALYAFCREVDDIADGPGGEGGKLSSLGRWRDEISQTYEGRPGGLTSHALEEPIRRFGLPEKDFIAIIDGMEMDAAKRLRIADMDELD
ncbi:MAG: squalene/phytoene synthase family protein, partial [Rhodospirillales bacterium]